MYCQLVTLHHTVVVSVSYMQTTWPEQQQDTPYLFTPQSNGLVVEGAGCREVKIVGRLPWIGGSIYKDKTMADSSK